MDADRPIPLTGPLNPAWSASIEAFRIAVVAPALGADRTSLTESEWKSLTEKFAAFEKWLTDKDGAIVEKLGPARARALLMGPEKTALAALFAADTAFASVERLTRYYRDLRVLLHNFVNFADFYSPDRLATFQAGVLYLDSRACELCVRVEDPAAHAILATMSKAYIVYADLKRAGETMKIAACVTQGDSDYLFVGRNGIFYDRRGRDWHAVITKIIDNPISIREAFWSPYKKVLRAIEAHVAKQAAAADAQTLTESNAAAAAALLAPTAAPTAAAAPPPPKKFDVGTVAALGVGVGAISSAVALIASKFVDVPAWKIAAAIAVVMLLISLPSMVIAWLKLRQRTLGPILEANGWAINGRVKINIPFGTVLTEAARLPRNAKRTLLDPYADKGAQRRRRWFITFVVVIALFLGAAFAFGFWPFTRAHVFCLGSCSGRKCGAVGH